MQPDTSSSPSANIPPVNYRPSNMFGSRVPASVSFVVGILLFFLPFAQVKCNGMALAENSGFGIAIGSEWKSEASRNLFGKNDMDDQKTDKERKQDPNLFAILALGTGLLGLLLCFGNARIGGVGGMVAGIIAAGCLIGLSFDLKGLVNEKSPHADKGLGDKNLFGMGDLNDIVATVEFTPWFYVAVVAFFAAAAFCFRRMQLAGRTGLRT